MSRILSGFFWGGWLCFLAGCGELRPSDSEGRLPMYEGRIRTLLQARCVRCHGSSSPAGSYDLSSYRGLLGPGTDLVRNARPGDPASRLLTRLDPVTEPGHYAHLLPGASELASGETAQARQQADLALLTAWVGEGGLAYADMAVHPPRTWVNPEDRNSPEFHGGALRKRAWNTAACQGCHGQDLLGRDSGGGSCRTCHPAGPNACSTCHGSAASPAPPSDLSWNLLPSSLGVGAHAVHLRSRTWAAAVACADCHRVPASLNDAGHLDGTGPAELTFSDKARGRLRGSGVDLAPVWDRASATCSQVYCHALSGAHGPGPVWNRGASGAIACGACHGLPPQRTLSGTAHPASSACSGCHSKAYTASGALDPQRHMNGTVDL